MQTQEMINQVATAIVMALIDRLTSDEVFIGKIGEKVNALRTVQDESWVNKIVKEGLAEFSVSADDVSGLDEFVENKFENSEIDVDRINGLEDMIDGRINDIDAESISGLDGAIENAVESAVESAVEEAVDKMDKEVSAEDVRDFDSEVRRVIGESLELSINMNVRTP